MNKKATDIVCYLSPIGFLIAYIVGARAESNFHLNQSLVLIVCQMALSALQKIAGYIPLIGTIINIVLGFVSFVVFVIWVMALVSAIQEKEKPMPLLGWVKLI